MALSRGVVLVSIFATLFAPLLAIQLVKEEDIEQQVSEQETRTLKNATSLQQFWAMASYTNKAEIPASTMQKQTWEKYRPCASCKNFSRFGEGNDGGYVMCGELLEGTKALYSYGINGFDGWGAILSDRLGVAVEQYDCFNTNRPACPDRLNCQFQFHAECIGTQTSGTKSSLTDQLKRNGHLPQPNSKADLIMKMDIEGAEWDILADEVNKPLLAGFSQLLIEFHNVDQANAVKAKAIQNVLDNFVVVHVHGNNCGGNVQTDDGYSVPTVLEVSLVRRGLVEEKTCEAAPVHSDLDHRNCNWIAETPPIKFGN